MSKQNFMKDIHSNRHIYKVSETLYVLRIFLLGIHGNRHILVRCVMEMF